MVVKGVVVVVAAVAVVARDNGNGGGLCPCRGVLGILDLLGISRKGLGR